MPTCGQAIPKSKSKLMNRVGLGIGRLFGALIAAWLSAAALGCGGANTIDISGEVKFGGKPIPAGRIYFTPDSSKGNEGPQGFAEITDGKYDTRREGRGAVAGANIVKIAGNDGSRGNGMGLPLFDDFSQPAMIPTSAATQDFDVPANAPKTRKVTAKKM
jgi:hypothetical protein